MMDNFDWREAVEQALRDYHKLDALRNASLRDLLVTRRLVSSEDAEQLREHREAIAVQKLIDLGIAKLEGFEPDLATILDQRFRRRRSVNELQYELHSSKTVIYERQKQGINALMSVLIRLESEAVDEVQARNQALLQSLPHPTYQQWLGDDEDLERVHRVLDDGRKRGANTPLFITGIGGLGKTSLAREAIATWLESTNCALDSIFWSVVAQPINSLATALQKPRRRYTLDQVLADLGEQLDVHVSALPDNDRKLWVIAQALQNMTALIVVDNVETPDEATMAIRLVEFLGPAAQLLVTSRYQIEYASGYGVALRELSNENAHRLLASETQRLSLSEIDQDVFRRLYVTLGGHPHALKMAVAQLGHLPVEQALRGFADHSMTAQALFHYIYNRAWSLLSPEAQDLMVGLWLLPPAGASWEGLKVALGASGGVYTDEDLQRYIQELTALNLIQTTQARPLVYSLHRLTYNFLAYRMGFGENGGRHE